MKREKKQCMSESKAVSLTNLTVSVGGRKSLMFIAYRFFHFRRPPGLRLAFDTTAREPMVMSRCFRVRNIVGSAIRRGRVNRRSINVKKR